MYWRDLTSPELDAVDRAIPVLLPVAAIEQHGPHLPLKTDAVIAAGLLETLNQDAPDNALILPVQEVGCSEHHLGFPGSLSLQHPHWLNVIEDLASSVFLHGFRNLVIFNAHGGNQAIGQVALERIGHRNPDREIFLVTWWKLASEALRTLNQSGPGGAGHACEFETSLMLHFDPDAVRTDLIPEKGNRPGFSWAEGDMLRGAEVSHFRSMRQMTTDGSYGQPRSGSPEQGETITRITCQRLVEILEEIYRPSHSV